MILLRILSVSVMELSTKNIVQSPDVHFSVHS